MNISNLRNFSYLIAASLIGLLISAVYSSSVSAESNLSMERKVELIELLRKDCGSCHGNWLKGNLGPPLLPSKLRDKSRDYLIKKIKHGVEGSAMPAWKDSLTSEEIEFLVKYLTVYRNVASSLPSGSARSASKS